MSLGNNIKHARKAAGLTQEDIAKEIRPRVAFFIKQKAGQRKIPCPVVF